MSCWAKGGKSFKIKADTCRQELSKCFHEKVLFPSICMAFLWKLFEILLSHLRFCSRQCFAWLTAARRIKEARRSGCHEDTRGGLWDEASRSNGRTRRMSSFHFQLHWCNLFSSVEESSACLKQTFVLVRRMTRLSAGLGSRRLHLWKNTKLRAAFFSRKQQLKHTETREDAN